MRLWRVIRQRMRSVVHRARVESELEGEFALHYEQLVRENIAAGMEAEAAKQAAHREFGNSAMFRERCRDQRRVNWLDDLFKDLAHGGRLLRRSPGFTAVAVVSLALGIGANTTIFTMVYRTLIERMPVREPEQLFTISRRNLERSNQTSFPHPFFRQLLASNTVFDGIVCRTSGQVAIGDERQAEMASIELVSGNFFDVIGVKPLMGRTFTRDDDRTPGAHPVLVLSHNYWVRHFAGDSAVVGRTLRVNTLLMTVLGVLPADFDGLRRGLSPDAYLPVTMQSEAWLSRSLRDSSGDWWLGMVGRLRRDVSLPQAEAAVLSQLKSFTDQHPAGQPETEYRRRLAASMRIELQPLANNLKASKQLSTTLLVLFGLSTVVLLIACTNLTNLLLARNSSRRHEFAVRLSLGASRGRVLRQLTAESLLLAFGGGALGLLVACLSGPVLVRLLMGDSPNVTLNVRPNRTLLFFNFGVTGLSAIVFGLGPAWQGIREGIAAGLGDARAVAPSRLFGRKLLLTAQTALSLLLLFGAALFLRSFHFISKVELGFRPEQLVQATLTPQNAGYKTPQILPLFSDVKARLESVPGVRSASFSMLQIMSGNEWGSGITVEGFTPREDDPGPSREAVGPDYFRTLGVAVLQGREFTTRDDARAAKVAMINESFARSYFSDADPIGKRIGPGGSQAKAEYTIVGVVRDTKYSDFRDEAKRVWYTPVLSGSGTPRTLYVRADVTADRALALVRNTVAAIDRNIPLQDAKSVAIQVAERSRRERMLATLATFFAGLAGFLAAIGIYGVVSFSVRQRLREIGIRLALGAVPKQVFAAVIGDVTLFAGLGFALACPAVWYVSRLVSDLLFRVEPLDRWSLVVACLAMAGIVLVAGAIPARVASRVEPAATLRAD